jgi:diaminohydroxyphosphoribosylaminopyrimidine deaminase / 5-amino-6-(5-phosphoribosylamino)uracil reductase
MTAAVPSAKDNGDIRFMELALSLGARGLGRTWPNPAVGAVVVRREADGPVIVGRGWTQPGGRPHAETQALARAGAAARGATLYVTLEPCSHHGQTAPCADAVIAAGVTEVVSALEDPNPQVAGEGHRRLAAAGIKVRLGVGAEEARHAHAGHIRRMREGRPQILLKLAVSADGKVGLAPRRPIAITGEAARERVHLMRATSDAVLTGSGTIAADDPLLTCRLPGMARRSPVRIVLDTKLKLSLDARVVASAREVPLWVLCGGEAAPEREAALRARGLEVIRVPAAVGGLDLKAALQTLGTRGITRLMAECGPILAAALLRADLIDEAFLLRSADAIGPQGIGALEGLPLEALTGSPKLKIIGTEAIGADRMDILARR